MTVPEVAAYLRVHQSTVYRLLKSGALPGWRIGAGKRGGDWRFSRKAIEQWVERNQQSEVAEG
jgi:excisionase family DNA binding protein